MKKYVLILALFASNLFAQTGYYKIDPEHSFANWKIRHVVAKTSGTIPNMTGTMQINLEDMNQTSVQVEMSLLDINSHHKKRDNHIQEEKFLNTALNPKIQFVSHQISMTDDNNGIVSGVLSLGGVEKKIDIPFTVLGFGEDPWGGFRVGLEGNIILHASDFGYTWGVKENSALGDKIEINLLLEGIKQ